MPTNSGPDYGGYFNRLIEYAASGVEQLKQIAASIRALPQVIQEAVHHLAERLRKITQAQVTMELLKHRVQVSSANAQMQAETGVIEEEHRLIERELQRISDIYDKLQHDLDDRHVQAVRRLGAHIFEMLEVDYERGIERRLQTGLAEGDPNGKFVQEFEQHNHQVLAFRNEQVQTVADDFSGLANDYLGARRSFRQRMAEMLVPKGDLPTQKILQLPLWLLEYETPDGGVTREVHFLANVEAANGPLVYKRIEPSPAARPVADALLRQMSSLFDRVPWSDPSPQQAGTMLSQLEQAVKEGWIRDEGEVVFVADLERCLREAPILVSQEHP